MKKILITDPVDPRCAELLSAEGFEVDYKPGLKPDELKKIIGIYNALIVRSETRADVSLIALMDSMEVIGRAGAGIDNIDVDAATQKGIIVMNTPGGNTISAAEHTMALLLSMSRNIPQANASLRDKKWERKRFTGSELSGKTIFIIGLGKIGKEVALRCQAFGMEVLAYDPVINPTTLANIGEIEFVSLEEGFMKSDFITLHVPLTSTTKNLISSETLKQCKDGVRIINCARGGIVNEEDVLSFIDKGKVASAAFDVYEKEPPDFNSPVFQHPKVICTPHLGASTEEAQEKVAIQIGRQISDYFRYNNFSGSVNTPFQKIDPALEKYLLLAERLGYLQSQFLKSSLKEVKISISGEFLHFYTQLLTSGIIKGFLSDRRTENINYINAQVIFKQTGIPVSETRNPDDENYSNLLSVTFRSDEGEITIAGTVFGNREMRIVKIDNYFVEFNPEGDFLIYYNIDKPGVLASVSSLLASKGYNISGVFLGRDTVAKKALTIIGIDEKINDGIKEIINSTDGILEVYTVNSGERR
jgi:D-3-phosphoglycerate dehydrogenase / 2-oxoglutarate reductase